MSKVLVTGGCGYIGSHMIVDLLQKGFDVISVDNYSNSFEKTYDAVAQICGRSFEYYSLDLCDKSSTIAFVKNHPEISSIIHFAAHKSVPESVLDPLIYYENNLQSMTNLLFAMEGSAIRQFVFSSSCSVYGNPASLPVTEESPLQPASPYAFSKQIGEQMIIDYLQKYKDCQFHLLRYFNPAGNHESALIGELPRKTYLNLVPVITKTAVGKLPPMKVFGNDFNTRDGSCVRDYVHVMDITKAHTMSLQYMMEGKEKKSFDIFNLGTGNGVTTLEAIHAFEKVSAQKLPFSMAERRSGDVESIYANNDKAKRILGWEPTNTLDEIMKSAWDWELKQQEKEMSK